MGGEGPAKRERIGTEVYGEAFAAKRDRTMELIEDFQPHDDYPWFLVRIKDMVDFWKELSGGEKMTWL